MPTRVGREPTPTLTPPRTDARPAHSAVSGRLAIVSSALAGFDSARVIAAATHAGLGAIEWAIGGRQALSFPIALDAGPGLRRRCAAAGLQVCGLSVQDGVLDDRTPVARLLELAGELGAPHVRLKAPPFEPGELVRGQRELDRLLERGGTAAGDAGLALLVEAVPGSSLICAGLLQRVLARHSPQTVGVVLDPGSMVIEGHLSPELTVELLGAYIRHVHVKNLGWRRRDGRWTVVRTRVDAGIVDWSEVFRALEAIGYAGWFAFDHLPGVASGANLRREAGLARELTGR
jgi:sugar phosphate isomerase/epimerase